MASEEGAERSDDTDQSGPFAKEMALLLRDLRKQWFPPGPPERWSHWKRFAFTAAGSFTFFMTVPWLRLSLMEANQEATYLKTMEDVQSLLANYQSGSSLGISGLPFEFWPATVFILSVGTVFFGYLASSGEHRRGPIRLYFSGLLLPAITTFVIAAALP